MQRRVTRSIVPICFVAVLQQVLAQDAAPAGELTVIDLRPKEERDGNALMPLAGKCNKDVYRIPDVASDPLKVDVLKADLIQQLGLAGDGKTLTVLNWSVYYNKQGEHGGSPALQSVGVQGYSIPGKKKEQQQGSKCSRQESAGGWFQAGDVTSRHAPLVSEFQGTFGGKPLRVRTVYSPHMKIDGKFDGNQDDSAVLLEALHKTAEAVAMAIVE